VYRQERAHSLKRGRVVHLDQHRLQRQRGQVARVGGIARVDERLGAVARVVAPDLALVVGLDRADAGRAPPERAESAEHLAPDDGIVVALVTRVDCLRGVSG
jgi:hypothetical protein